ncbi:MAG: hypothetical protein EOO73_21910 [Myxococcales bacterium]|nr:MAG: hypothetical protein EOO73_21910 [Myxococcales bacterium]
MHQRDPWLSTSVLSAFLLLTGCSGDDDSRSLFQPGPALPECPNADYSTCDVREADCQDRLLELAACVRGREPPARLQIDVMTKAEYLEMLRDDAADRPEPELQHFSRALSLFNLAPKDGVPYDDQLEEQAEFVGGQYRQDEKRIIVVDHGRAASSADIDATLLHEFVHALQDDEHDLETWPSEETVWTFDSTLAARTIVEGEASFYESRISAPLLGLDYRRVDFESTFQNFMDRLLVKAFDSPLLLSQSQRTLPYGVGALQAFHAWEVDGPSAIERLWSDPPLTMQKVLSPLFGRNRPQSPSVEVPPPEVPEGLTLYGDDTLGAWGLCLVLTKRTGVPARVTDFIDQALMWRGDRLSVYSGEDDSTYALWQLELESSTAADELDEFFDDFPVEHGAVGKRVFVSYNMNDLSASAALTQWGEAWVASSSD